MINKLKIPLIAIAVLALGIIIYPKPPHVNGSALLRKVLRAQQKVCYGALQEHTTVILDRKIRSTIYTKNDFYEITKSTDIEPLILRNYIPLVEGQDRIAGRETWILRLKPRVKQMPWKQIWVDKHKYVILASRDWTAYNVVKRSMKTVSISFEGGSLRKIKSGKNRPTSKCDIPKPSYIPHGFVPVSADKDTMVYSDGLYSISITRSNKFTPQKKVALDCGQGLIFSTGRYTVVADLPADKIERIAHSIAP
ncbi:hypothetical protein LLG46_10120 [bacterium]|nr:hypothetical protein [bacterium]